jgi:hypothetical protein
MDTQDLISRMSENLSVRRAFGAAYEKDGLLVIPVALVAGGGGGGEGTMPKDRGRGPRPAPETSDETAHGPECLPGRKDLEHRPVARNRQVPSWAIEHPPDNRRSRAGGRHITRER